MGTFICALPLSGQKQWADKMSRAPGLTTDLKDPTETEMITKYEYLLRTLIIMIILCRYNFYRIR